MSIISDMPWWGWAGIGIGVLVIARRGGGGSGGVSLESAAIASQQDIALGTASLAAQSEAFKQRQETTRIIAGAVGDTMQTRIMADSVNRQAGMAFVNAWRKQDGENQAAVLQLAALSSPTLAGTAAKEVEANKEVALAKVRADTILGWYQTQAGLQLGMAQAKAQESSSGGGTSGLISSIGGVVTGLIGLFV